VQYAKKRITNGFLQKPIRIDDMYDEVNNQLLAYELDKKISSLMTSLVASPTVNTKNILYFIALTESHKFIGH
jgi:hypothetical protein